MIEKPISFPEDFRQPSKTSIDNVLQQVKLEKQSFESRRSMAVEINYS